VRQPPLGLMTHPAVLYPPIERAAWTVESVRNVFDAELAARQLPLGVVCLDATVHPYQLAYPVGTSDPVALR
jgi:hypothetical protein